MRVKNIQWKKWTGIEPATCSADEKRCRFVFFCRFFSFLFFCWLLFFFFFFSLVFLCFFFFSCVSLLFLLSFVFFFRFGFLFSFVSLSNLFFVGSFFLCFVFLFFYFFCYFLFLVLVLFVFVCFCRFLLFSFSFQPCRNLPPLFNIPQKSGVKTITRSSSSPLGTSEIFKHLRGMEFWSFLNNGANNLCANSLGDKTIFRQCRSSGKSKRWPMDFGQTNTGHCGPRNVVNKF